MAFGLAICVGKTASASHVKLQNKNEQANTNGQQTNKLRITKTWALQKCTNVYRQNKIMQC